MDTPYVSICKNEQYQYTQKQDNVRQKAYIHTEKLIYVTVVVIVLREKLQQSGDNIEPCIEIMGLYHIFCYLVEADQYYDG